MSRKLTALFVTLLFALLATSLFNFGQMEILVWGIAFLAGVIA